MGAHETVLDVVAEDVVGPVGEGQLGEVRPRKALRRKASRSRLAEAPQLYHNNMVLHTVSACARN